MELAAAGRAGGAAASGVPGRARQVRAYERWPGRQTFYCKGRLVSGPPGYPAMWGSTALILIPAVVFNVTVAGPLLHSTSAAFLVVGVVLPALSLAFLFVAACMDPGVLPRAEPDEEWELGRLPRTREVENSLGNLVTVRYNESCHFYQPPRAHHCSVTDECIERFDHFCPWVGSTVGLRNYRFFVLFVYFTTLLGIYVFGSSAYLVKLRYDDTVSGGEPSVLKALGQEPGAVVVMVYVFLVIWFVGGLSAFHSYLICTNQTTYEKFRYSYSESDTNPYDRGCLGNWAEVFCTRVPPSKCDFRAIVEEVPVTAV